MQIHYEFVCWFHIQENIGHNMGRNVVFLHSENSKDNMNI